MGVRIGSAVSMGPVAEPPPANGIRVSMVIGSRRPIYIGSTGKGILSGLSYDRVRSLLGEDAFPPCAPHNPPPVDGSRLAIRRVPRRAPSPLRPAQCLTRR